MGRLMFSPEADNGVEEQQDRDDDQIHPVADDGGERRRHFDHPRNWSREIAEKLQQRALLFLIQRIGAEFFQPLFRFRLTQAVSASPSCVCHCLVSPNGS